MSDYIDKSNLYKSIVDREEEYYSALLKEKNYSTPVALQLQGLLNATTLIKHLVFDYPTVDAVEVVRCKDCKYNYHNMIPSGEAEYACTKCIELPITADFYCAKGVGKDAKTN